MDQQLTFYTHFYIKNITQNFYVFFNPLQCLSFLPTPGKIVKAFRVQNINTTYNIDP